MENTRSNSKSISSSQIIEMVCSVVLLICLFLPWVTMFKFSVTAFDVINLATKANSYLPYGQSSAFGSGGAMGSLFTALLFLQLIMFIVNPIVQYSKRIPWLSFYTAWIPVSMGLALWYKTATGDSDGFGLEGFYGVNIGAGAVLSVLAGLLMQFSAWTTIGVHYKKYRKYFRLALIWCIAGWMCYILGIAIASSNSISLLDIFTADAFLILLTFLVGVLAVPGIGHTLWLIYGGIVMLLSSTSDSTAPEPTMQSAQENPGDFLSQVRRRSDEELKYILQHKEDYNEHLVRAAQDVVLERISNPVAVTSPATLLEETDDNKYKAYQPKSNSTSESLSTSVHAPTSRSMSNYDVAKSSLGVDGSVSKSSETGKPQEESRQAIEPKSAETVASATRPTKNSTFAIISVMVGVLLAVGGVLGYFLWYAPYVKDRDAVRTYVVATNVFLRSSRISGVEYNILAKIPYGTEVITYNKLGEWAEVKVNGQEGVIATPYLLDSNDFVLLNSVWGDVDTRECIESSKCRLAILDYLKNNHIKTGPSAWEIHTKPINQKPNTVFYPRLYNRNSKYTDFMFILSDNATDNRMLVCYSFEDTTEKPIFRFSVGAPRAGFIKNVVNRNEKVQVIFDTNQVLNISFR